jgi:hypothetical protein
MDNYGAEIQENHYTAARYSPFQKQDTCIVNTDLIKGTSLQHITKQQINITIRAQSVRYNVHANDLGVFVILGRSNTWIVGSNSGRVRNICPCLCVLCSVLVTLG